MEMNPEEPREEPAQLSRQSADQAVQLALEGRWEEAATLNRAILSSAEKDVEAWNRLGKALNELGRYKDAYDAYGKSIELDPINTIAKRNLERLSAVQEVELAATGDVAPKVAQDIFIEEVGKSGVTILEGVPREVLATLTAGDEVYLKPAESLINIDSAKGDTIGAVEPKLGLRLLRLIDGGNRYAAAVKSIGESEAEVIIKEIYKDPSQTRLSFPAGAREGVRAYTKESLLRLGDDDDDEVIEGEIDSEEWEAEGEETEAARGSTEIGAIAEQDDEDDEIEE